MSRLCSLWSPLRQTVICDFGLYKNKFDWWLIDAFVLMKACVRDPKKATEWCFCYHFLQLNLNRTISILSFNRINAAALLCIWFLSQLLTQWSNWLDLIWHEASWGNLAAFQLLFSMTGPVVFRKLSTLIFNTWTEQWDDKSTPTNKKYISKLSFLPTKQLETLIIHFCVEMWKIKFLFNALHWTKVWPVSVLVNSFSVQTKLRFQRKIFQTSLILSC